ncbi:MAG: multidrug efflux RND transporter permease subunit [Gammaproteobacteria bacterium]|nr:multidrug efflux RND transporter permease subunit [Gammaproteobacteria bacterium]
MNISAPFIRRPVATTLLTIALGLLGLVAMSQLPVSPLPQVDIPTIAVTANLPGASPETMAATVATPLERQLGRIAGVNEITSSSSLGATRVVLQFDLERDIDGAARDVQAAINAARSQLPSNLPHNPIYRKVNPADAPVMILTMASDFLNRGQLYDAASTIVAQKLSQVSGVGQVVVSGASLPAVRVELNPFALNKYGIGIDEVGNAIAAANPRRPKGSIEGHDRHWQIYARDQAQVADDYRSLILTHREQAPVRLSDIAEVTDSVEDIRNDATTNGKPSVLLFVHRQPGANIIETVEQVRALLPQLRASIPRAIDLSVTMDRTPTIRASLLDTERTLVIAVALVVLVVFLFLRNPRAALIPSVVVPVSLIATFGVLYLCGYSLDIVSLMALTIASGFVVDDAIVVLENTLRHIEHGMSPLPAALRGAREVGFTVLSMSLSLIAVFIPILFMAGIPGRFLRVAAVTVTAAVLVSLVMSLTTTPMMCARLRRHDTTRPQSRTFAVFERGFDWMLRRYQESLTWALQHGRFIMALLLATVCLNVYLYVIVPKGFLPAQDTGRISGSIVADQSISFQAMRQKLTNFSDIVRTDPAVDTVVSNTGGGQRNTGSMFISLKPLNQRDASAEEVITRLRDKLAQEPGAKLFLRAVSDFGSGGRQSGAMYQYSLQSDNLDELRAWIPRLEQALKQVPQLADVNTDQYVAGLQTQVVIDRSTAARLGITPKMIDTTLQSSFGQRHVSTIYAARNQYYVVMEVAPPYQQHPEALRDTYVRNSAGTPVPLSSFSRYETTTTALAVNHQGQLPAATISFNLPLKGSLSAAVAEINSAMARIDAPASLQGGFQGTARVFQESQRNQVWLILAALITLYIVLGVLYESYVHPITILSTLPSAGVGALLALLVLGIHFDLIGLIGVIMLIGIVKKNAIMMIDFALEAERKEGKSPEAAILQACLLRFRPIMMTTLAALLGALPLAIGFGEGAELRRPLGVSVVGGLLVSQLLTLYTTPVVYLYLDRFRLWCRRIGARRTDNASLDPVSGIDR